MWQHFSTYIDKIPIPSFVNVKKKLDYFSSHFLTDK